MAAVLATGLASAVQGVRFSRLQPGGAVPLEDGSHAAPGATVREARAKRTLGALGAASVAAEVGLIAVDAALNQSSFRRPPLRRSLLRRT